MKTEIHEGLLRIVILDISGVYVQIHDEGYFDEMQVQDIRKQYSDINKWKIIVI